MLPSPGMQSYSSYNGVSGGLPRGHFGSTGQFPHQSDTQRRSDHGPSASPMVRMYSQPYRGPSSYLNAQSQHVQHFVPDPSYSQSVSRGQAVVPHLQRGFSASPVAHQSPGLGGSGGRAYTPRSSGGADNKWTGGSYSPRQTEPYRNHNTSVDFMQHSPGRGLNRPAFKHSQSSPSISMKRLAPPQSSFKPLRSPGLSSRGPSPVGSSFSGAGSSTPTLDMYGMPIAKPRVCKVRFPREVDAILPEEIREISLWSRRPLRTGPSCTHLPLVDTRTREPHPEDKVCREELPDTIEIYLPNDWKELQLQILEQQLFKIGITRDYINGMDAALNASLANSSLPVAATHLAGGGVPQQDVIAPHQRTASLFVPNGPILGAPRDPSRHPLHPLTIRGPRFGHSSAMSYGGPATTGSAIFQSLPSNAFPLVNGNPTRITEVEEVEEVEQEAEPLLEVEIEQEEILKPARLLTLKELNAGFGITSDSETECKPAFPHTAHPLSRSKGPSWAHLQTEHTTTTSQDIDTTHTSGAKLCSTPPPQASGCQSVILSAARHQAKRSMSAPDLSLVGATCRSLRASPPRPVSELGYTAEDSDVPEDVESDASGDYSNPSDVERAKERRDLSSSLHNALSPVTVMRKSSTVRPSNIVPEEPEVNDLSDNEAIIRPALMNTPASGDPLHLQHNTHPSTTSSATVQASGRRLNAAAPEFVFGQIDQQLPRLQLAGASPPRQRKDQSKPSMNPAAPAFVFGYARKPRSTEDGSHRQAEAHWEHKSRSNLSVDNSIHTAGHNMALTMSASDAKQGIVWLSDTSNATPSGGTAFFDTAHPSMSTTVAPAVQSVSNVADLLSFKTSWSPSLPYGSARDNVPQLPPLGTIGRNTRLNSAFSSLFGDDDDEATQDASLIVPHRVKPSHKHKPLPDFDLLPPPVGLEGGSTITLNSSDGRTLEVDAAISPESGVREREALPLLEQHAEPYSSIQGKDINFSEQGSPLSSPSSIGSSRSSRSDISSEFRMPPSNVSASRQTFEDVLAAKVDRLRKEILSQLTAQMSITQVQATALTSIQSPIQASLAQITLLLDQKLPSLSVDALPGQIQSRTARLPDSLDKQLETQSARIEDAVQSMLAAAETRIVENEQRSSSKFTAATSLALSDLDARFENIVHDNARKIFDDHSKTLRSMLEDTLSSISAERRDTLQNARSSQVEIMKEECRNLLSTLREEYDILQEHNAATTLREVREELAQTIAEKAAQLEHFTRAERRYDEDVQTLRDSIAAKDRELADAVSALQQHRTSIDAEHQIRQQDLCKQIEDYKALCGGMEAELKIYKSQSRDWQAEKQRMEALPETHHRQMADVQAAHYVQIQELREVDIASRAKAEISERRLKQQDDILAQLLRDKEASQALQAELQGKLILLHDAHTLLREQSVIGQERLERLTADLANVQAQLRTSEDVRCREREAFESQLGEYNRQASSAERHMASLATLLGQTHKFSMWDPIQNPCTFQDVVYESYCAAESGPLKILPRIQLSPDVSADMSAPASANVSTVSSKPLPQIDDSGWFA